MGIPHTLSPYEKLLDYLELGREHSTQEKTKEIIENFEGQMKEFVERLFKHDWFYSYSDDNGVWYRGNQEENQLIALSEKSDSHKKIFQAFKKYYK